MVIVENPDKDFNKFIEQIKKANPQLLHNPDILPPWTPERYEPIKDIEKSFHSNQSAPCHYCQ